MKVLATIKDIGHTGKVLAAYVSYSSEDGEYTSSVQVPLTTAIDKVDIDSQIQLAVLTDANLKVGKGALLLTDIIIT